MAKAGDSPILLRIESAARGVWAGQANTTQPLIEGRPPPQARPCSLKIGARRGLTGGESEHGRTESEQKTCRPRLCDCVLS
jgi:hypothetical protein